MADIYHDVFQFCVDFFKCPAQTLAVLSHFKCGCCNTTSVCSFSGCKENTVLLQVLCSLDRSRHISALCNNLAAVSNKLLSIVKQPLVLSYTRKGNINFNGPYSSSLMVLGIRTVFLVFCQSCAVYFFDPFDRGYINSVRIIYPSV